jgi:O-antigen ligase
MKRLQSLALALIAALAAHTGFMLIWAAPTQHNIIFELRGVVLKLSDIPFLIVAVISAARFTRPNRLMFPWYGLVIWMAMSALWSSQPILAAYQAGYTALMLLMAAAFRREKNIQTINAVFAVASAFQGILCMAQWLNGGALGLSWLGEVAFIGSRAQGLTFNANTAGSYLMMGVFMAVLAFQRTGQRGLLILAASSLGGLLATGSRAPLIALILAFVVYCKGAPYCKGAQPCAPTRIILAALAGIVIIAARNPQEILNRLTYAFPGTLAVIQEAPLLGAGAGNLMIAVDGVTAVERVFAHGFLQPAHNAYLTLWAELGLPGLVLFAAGCWPILWRSRTMAGACLLAMLLVMLLEFHFWLDAHWRMMFFWMAAQALFHEKFTTF